uniref:DDE Tnp4 domain-containing protein n=1 Tax=Vitis vinifera TaxID=29760 RepID=A5BKE3_VITVI|nr:hypothetical protein VITISV_036360 [Vitis vinifera]
MHVHIYPEAKQFYFKPLANVEELEALFGGVLATRSKNWSSGGVIASGAEESSTHSTSMPSETSISLEEDEDLPRNTNDEAEGSLFIQELLNGSSSTCYELMRMEKHGFISLCHMFREKGWLVDSKHLNVEEKMVMFLMTISHNLRNRLIKNRFQHSSQTIHKYFHEVLVAMVNFSKEMITLPLFNDSSNGISNRRLRQIFKNVVGAIDGTLIHACIPTNQQVPYRGRGKGECFQNVMAVCDFDIIFRFVVVGWEGTTHDSRVLTETIHYPQHNFPMAPSEKYYLVDAAYTHTRGFMAPYRNVKTRSPMAEFETRNSEECKDALAKAKFKPLYLFQTKDAHFRPENMVKWLGQ